MRWTTDLEHLVSEKLAEGTCPLCGGRVKLRRTYVGREVVYVQAVCEGCGMAVGDAEQDGPHI